MLERQHQFDEIQFKFDVAVFIMYIRKDRKKRSKTQIHTTEHVLLPSSLRTIL